MRFVQKKMTFYRIWWTPSSLFSFNSVEFGGSYPGNVLVATSGERKAQERDAEEGRVLWRPAQSFGEDVSEAEIHQQTGQEETGCQTQSERFSGKSLINAKQPSRCFTAWFAYLI